MGIGKTFKSTPEEFIDASTGLKIIKPLSRCTCRHLYFTSNPFALSGNEIIISCIKDKAENFCLLDFKKGIYTQLTDSNDLVISASFFDRRNNRLYYSTKQQIFCVDIYSLNTELIYTGNHQLYSFSVTCDGKYLVASDTIEITSLDNDKNIRSETLFRIFRITLASGTEKTLIYRKNRIDHIQCHPVDCSYIMYCLHGYFPTHQRIWHLDIEGLSGGPAGNEQPNEHRTHEYFVPGTDKIAYHGKFFSYGNNADFKVNHHTFGIMNKDGSDDRYYKCIPEGMNAGHSSISNSGKLVVSDGGSAISIMDFNDISMTVSFEPLAYHNSSFSNNFVHPHPSFSVDDRYILFASDMNKAAKGGIYLIDLHSKSKRLGDRKWY